MDVAPGLGGVGIGSNITPSGLFEVTGAKTGNALVVLNETGNQDILTASASGVTQLTLSNTGNLFVSGGLSTYDTTVTDGYVEASGLCLGNGTNCITSWERWQCWHQLLE
jgi:hypothetical protein